MLIRPRTLRGLLLVGALVFGANVSHAETPQWIWGSKNAAESAEVGRCDFRHAFELESPQTGVLRITCDDRFMLRLNGRLVGLGADWQQQRAYDVSSLLKSGRNEIFVRCRNDGAAAGLLLNLKVELQDGTSLEISTNKEWQARLQQAGTWDPTIVDRTPWLPAATLGPQKTTPPWNDNVAVAGKVKSIQVAAQSADKPFELQDGDRVLFLGGTFIERAQRYGMFESALTTAFPKTQIVFRNLGWSGDTVFGHARARFGSTADGFEHLETHVFGEQPSVVFVAYGANEAFGGPAGLDEFTRGLNDLLDVLSTTSARIVLVTPILQENLGPPLPNPVAQNRNLELYRDRIVEVAKDRDHLVVDLFARLPKIAAEFAETQSLTDNGLHLHQRGYWYAAQAMLAELGLSRPVHQVTLDVASAQVETQGEKVTDIVAGPKQVRFVLQDQQVSIPCPPGAVTRSAEASQTESESRSPWRLAIHGLDAGPYTLRIDGQPVADATAAEWAAGVAINRGPQWDRSEQLVGLINKKNELYFHRWRPQNETYLFLFRKHEQGNNAAEIPMFDPLIQEVEQAILPLSDPAKYQFEITPAN